MLEKILEKTQYVKELQQKLKEQESLIRRLQEEREDLKRAYDLKTAAVCYLVDEPHMICKSLSGESYVFIDDVHMKEAMKKKLRIKAGFPTKGIEFRVVK